MFAYVGSRTTAARQGRGEGLTVWKRRSDGGWRRLQALDVPDPAYLCVSPSGHALYAAHGDSSAVSAFAIEDGGVLRSLGSQAFEGRNPVHLAVDPIGAHLLLADHDGGSIVAFPIRGDGSLAPPSDQLRFAESAGSARVSHPHQAVFTPDGARFLVPDKGLDCIAICALSAAGRLSVERVVACAAGSGPRHLVFAPDGRDVYVTNELNSTVSACRWDGVGGLVVIDSHPTREDASASCGNTAAAILIDPEGRFVLATNRGDDSIVVYRRDPADGALSLPQWTPTGAGPRFATWTSDDGELLVACEGDDTVFPLRIDVDGGLLPLGEALKTGSPTCIVGV